MFVWSGCSVVSPLSSLSLSAPSSCFTNFSIRSQLTFFLHCFSLSPALPFMLPSDDKHERLAHTYGKSFLDMVKAVGENLSRLLHLVVFAPSVCPTCLYLNPKLRCASPPRSRLHRCPRLCGVPRKRRRHQDRLCLLRKSQRQLDHVRRWNECRCR